MSQVQSEKNNFKLRPDQGFARIAGIVAEKLRRESGSAWAVKPSPDFNGSVSFYFDRGNGQNIIRWHDDGAGISLPGICGRFSYSEVNDKGTESLNLKALEAVLMAVCRNSSLKVLAPEKDVISTSDLQSVMLQIEREWLTPGQARWFDYAVRDVKILKNEISFSYNSEFAGVKFAITQRGSLLAADCHEKAFCSPCVICERGQFVLVKTADNRTESYCQAYEHQVERAAAFVFQRALPDDSIPVPEDDDIKATPADELSLRAQTAFELDRGRSWRQFMADSDFPNFFSASWQSSGKMALVSHSDRFCLYMRPYINGPLTPLIRYPWSNNTSPGISIYTTDLTDSDIINDGGEKRLSELMAHLETTSGGDCPIVVADTCIPKLLALETGNIIDEFKQRSKSPVLRPFSDAAWGAHLDGLSDIAAEFMTHVEARTRSADPSINIVGYRNGRDLEELSSELAGIGIRTVSLLLPNMDIEHVRDFYRAWLQVWLPSAHLSTVYENVFSRLNIPHIIPNAPFGITASWKWLDEIAENFGLGNAWREEWKKRQAAIVQELESLKITASRITLGFVVDGDQFPRIISGSDNFGLNPVAFLKESGFALAVYFFEESGDGYKKERLRASVNNDLTGAGLDSDAIDLRFFSNNEELEALLRSGPAVAVFSEYTGDIRLEKAGVAPFSLADFEMGFAGAFRSIRRLVNRCSCQYTARLGACLRRGNK